MIFSFSCQAFGCYVENSDSFNLQSFYSRYFYRQRKTYHHNTSSFAMIQQELDESTHFSNSDGLLFDPNFYKAQKEVTPYSFNSQKAKILSKRSCELQF